jgi:hypothetical protein
MLTAVLGGVFDLDRDSPPSAPKEKVYLAADGSGPEPQRAPNARVGEMAAKLAPHEVLRAVSREIPASSAF